MPNESESNPRYQLFLQVLDRLGVGPRPVTSIDYRFFLIQLAKQRDWLLEKYRWGFAEEEVRLERAPDAQQEKSLVYTNVYQLPHDFAALCFANGSGDVDVNWTPYRVSAPYFFCNYTPVIMVYTKQLLDEEMFQMSTTFEEALVLKVALRLCPKYTQNSMKYQELWGEYNELKMVAVQVENRNIVEMQNLANEDLLYARRVPYNASTSFDRHDNQRGNSVNQAVDNLGLNLGENTSQSHQQSAQAIQDAQDALEKAIKAQKGG